MRGEISLPSFPHNLISSLQLIETSHTECKRGSPCIFTSGPSRASPTFFTLCSALACNYAATWARNWLEPEFRWLHDLATICYATWRICGVGARLVRPVWQPLCLERVSRWEAIEMNANGRQEFHASMSFPSIHARFPHVLKSIHGALGKRKLPFRHWRVHGCHYIMLGISILIVL